MTNGDRVRAMSDEELAEFMYNGCDAISPDESCAAKHYNNCTECWIKYFESETESGR